MFSIILRSPGPKNEHGTGPAEPQRGTARSMERTPNVIQLIQTQSTECELEAPCLMSQFSVVKLK